MDCGIKINPGELGFGQIVYIPVQPMPLWEEGIKVRKAVDPGTADYWEARGLTGDCLKLMPDSKTIIAASYPYAPYQYPFKQGKGYYSGHYRAFTQGRKAIEQLGKILIDLGYKAIIDPPLPMKEIAYRSGLGVYGRNGLIHNEKYGSHMTLHMILTNAEFPYTMNELQDISDCGSCKRCMDSCPMHAIAENGTVIISKCMRYHMMSPNIIPIEVREKMGTRMLGCDECQKCCPKNRIAYRQAVTGDDNDNIFDIKELLSAYKTGLQKHMGPIAEAIGRNYARPQRILSMAVIAAGNLKDPDYLPLLYETLKHERPPIRAHSAWAIGKIGNESSIEILNDALTVESDPMVAEEIKLALSELV